MGEEHGGAAPGEPEGVVKDAPLLLVVLAVLVCISIAFEHGKDRLFRAARRGAGVRVINTLFGELTLLGFIGLLVYSVQRAKLLNELSALVYGDEEEDLIPELTENVHMAIFLVMMILLMLVLMLMAVARCMKAEWFGAETVARESEGLLNTFAHAHMELHRAEQGLRRRKWGSPCVSFALRCPGFARLCCWGDRHVAAAYKARELLPFIDSYLEHSALRSRFVWRPTLRRIPSMRVAREPATGVILQGHHGNRTDTEVLTGLRDVQFNLHRGPGLEDELLFDHKGHMLLQLRHFDFGLYLAARTESAVSALVELPVEVWLAELLLASTAFILVELPPKLSFVALVGMAMCLPLILLVLLQHLKAVRAELVSPLLHLQAEQHRETALKHLRQVSLGTLVSFGTRRHAVGKSLMSPSGKGHVEGFSASADLTQPLMHDQHQGPSSLNAAGASGPPPPRRPRRISRLRPRQQSLRRLHELQAEAHAEAGDDEALRLQKEGDAAFLHMQSRRLPVTAHLPLYLHREVMKHQSAKSAFGALTKQKATTRAVDTASKPSLQEVQQGARDATAMLLTRKVRRAWGVSDTASLAHRHLHLRMFWCGRWGPALYLFLFRFVLFTTAIYAGAFVVAAAPGIVQHFAPVEAAAIFAAALVPIVLVVVLLRYVLPHYVVVTSVEHLKVPRDVEKVMGVTRLRKALKALHFLLTLKHQAEQVHVIVQRQEANAKRRVARMIRKSVLGASPTAAGGEGGGRTPPSHARQGAGTAGTTRPRRASKMWGRLREAVPTAAAEQRSKQEGRELGSAADRLASIVNVVRLAQRLLPSEEGDSSDSDTPSILRTASAGMHLTPEDTRDLRQVNFDGQVSLMSQLFSADGTGQVEDGGLRRRRRLQQRALRRARAQAKASHAMELVDADEGLMAAWCELLCGLCEGEGEEEEEEEEAMLSPATPRRDAPARETLDEAAAMVARQGRVVERLSRQLRAEEQAGQGGEAEAKATVRPGEGEADTSSSSDESTLTEKEAEHGDWMKLSRNGAEFYVPTRLGTSCQRRRRQGDIYEAFDIIDQDNSGYLNAQELQQLLEQLGLPWATSTGAGHAIRVMYRLMQFNFEEGGEDASCARQRKRPQQWVQGNVMDFPLFLSWAQRLERQDIPLGQLAQVMLAELGQERGALTPTAFHKALTTLGMHMSLEDVRELFMEHNPDSRPDELSTAGLQDMLQSHL